MKENEPTACPGTEAKTTLTGQIAPDNAWRKATCGMCGYFCPIVWEKAKQTALYAGEGAEKFCRKWGNLCLGEAPACPDYTPREAPHD